MTMSQKDSNPRAKKTPNDRAVAKAALASDLSGRLLSWYDRHQRDLPWRAKPGATPTAPYRVWLSEIMMQQTTVAAGRPFFDRFVKRWPTIVDLAAADLDEILHAWQGLGYYARARNLHKCAQLITTQLGGSFPDTEVGLLALPGVGPYTAAAIAAIAFGRKATAVDGNVDRVMARLFAVSTPLPKAKGELKRLAQALTPETRCGDYAQAVMDLGATLCRPRNPACERCPWNDACDAFAQGRQGEFPRRLAKVKRPTRYGIVFWLERDDGAVLVRRRPDEGLLGGMIEFPSTEWRGKIWTDEDLTGSAPIMTSWRPVEGMVRHTFSHFNLELSVLRGRIGAHSNAKMPDGARWGKPSEFGALALPSVMKKVARLMSCAV